MSRALALALWSHWRHAPVQLAAVLIGLALATALWSGVQAINAEARASYDAAAATLGEGRYDQLVPRVGRDLDQEVFVRLRRAGWQVSPVLEGRLSDPDLRVVGVEPLTAPSGFVPAVSAGAGGQVDLGGFLGGRAVLAHPDTAVQLGTLPGLVPTAVPDMAPGIVMMDIGAAQRLLEQPGRLTRLIVAPGQPKGLPPLSEIAPEVLRRSAAEGSDVGQLTGSFHLNLTAFGLLSFVVGLFIVHGAVRLSFEQRRGLVRSLRAMGVPMRGLILAMLAEVLVLAMVAGTAGILLGYALAGILLPDVAATLRGLYAADVAGSVQLRASWIGAGLGMAVLGALAAAASGLWQIAGVPPLASARPRAWVTQARRLDRLFAATAAALLALAALCFSMGANLVTGFAGVACLLVGAALALPPLLRFAVTLAGGRARTPLAQWFWADTGQQVPGLGLALMALLLATSTNIGVSTMVSSFRLTFVEFLDQRLAPEVFVEVETEAQASAIEALPPDLVREVLPLRSVRARVMGQEASVYGVRVGQTYREDWRLLLAQPDPWSAVAQGQGAVINEQLHHRLALSPGDALALTPDLVVPVVGVVADYGNPNGQVILSEAVFATHYPAPPPRRFGLRTADPDALLRVLQEDLGLPTGAATDQAQIKGFSLQVFDRTFAVTAALNVLTLGVAGVAMLMSLLTLAAQRLPQVAPVWALGVTRRRLGQLELWRALALAVGTVLLALPLGLALAWALLDVVNVAAFGWRLPMFVFPWSYAGLALAACLAALGAALWPAWRLAHVPAASLLKVFANDR